MERNEVISILKNRDVLLCDCRQRRKEQQREKARVEKESEWTNKETLNRLYEESIRNIDAEEEKIDYVWFHFLQLPTDLHMLLDELYVKQSGWEYVLQEFSGSKNKLMERKNMALQQIVTKMNQKKGECV